MAAKRLTGIFQDGSSAFVPVNPRTVIRWTHGTQLTLKLALYSPGGEPIDLRSDGSMALTLSVRQHAVSEYTVPELLTLAGVVPAGGESNQAEFVIPSTAMQQYQPGRYFYGILAFYRGEYDYVVPVSPFLVAPSTRLLP